MAHTAHAHKKFAPLPTVRFRIWAWVVQQDGPITTRDAMREFKMSVVVASRHLGTLCGGGCLSRERIKGGRNRYAYRGIADCPPQYGMGNPRPADRPNRGLPIEFVDDIKRVNLSSANIRLLVDRQFLRQARKFECAPLVRAGQ